MKLLKMILKTSGLPGFLLIMLFLNVPFNLSFALGFPQGTFVQINPELKVNRTSKGSVIVSSRNANGTAVRHEFTDFYADLVLAAYRKQRLDYIENNLRKKYYLSEDDCRREIKHALNVLMEWNIILVTDHT